MAPRGPGGSDSCLADYFSSGNWLGLSTALLPTGCTLTFLFPSDFCTSTGTMPASSWYQQLRPPLTSRPLHLMPALRQGPLAFLLLLQLAGPLLGPYISVPPGLPVPLVSDGGHCCGNLESTPSLEKGSMLSVLQTSLHSAFRGNQRFFALQVFTNI